jgi:hypothetical protein
MLIVEVIVVVMMIIMIMHCHHWDLMVMTLLSFEAITIRSVTVILARLMLSMVTLDDVEGLITQSSYHYYWY